MIVSTIKVARGKTLEIQLRARNLLLSWIVQPCPLEPGVADHIPAYFASFMYPRGEG